MNDDAKASTDDAAVFADSVIVVAEGSPRRRRFRIAALAVGMLAIILIICAWSFTPLREWIDIDRLALLARHFSESPFGPLAMIAIFVVAGLLVVPVNVVTAVSLLVFGAVAGSIYALIGAVASAIVLYEIARRIPLRTAQQRFGPRLQTIHTHVLRHGILAVALVRLVPIAPYSVVCVLLGILRIRRLHYIIGTALGMAPGIVVNAFFVDRVVAAMRTPSMLAIALVALSIALIAALAWFARKRIAQHAP